MEIKKVGRKWIIQGKGKGWIFNRTFPAKWKAEIALEVFKEGGRTSDYWEKARDQSPPIREPLRVKKKLNEALTEIKRLNPTCDEIEEFGENADYGVATLTENDRYFPPQLHDTWGVKRGGRVHIDIGSRGTHLMLDKKHVDGFIQFIKMKRRDK